MRSPVFSQWWKLSASDSYEGLFRVCIFNVLSHRAASAQADDLVSRTLLLESLINNLEHRDYSRDKSASAEMWSKVPQKFAPYNPKEGLSPFIQQALPKTARDRW